MYQDALSNKELSHNRLGGYWWRPISSSASLLTSTLASSPLGRFASGVAAKVVKMVAVAMEVVALEVAMEVVAMEEVVAVVMEVVAMEVVMEVVAMVVVMVEIMMEVPTKWWHRQCWQWGYRGGCSRWRQR